MTCDIELTYYNTDDGVYLHCYTHKWDHNLGFSVTPETAMEEANKHRESWS